MGASVGLMMKILNPEWKIKMVERLDRVAGESSAGHFLSTSWCISEGFKDLEPGVEEWIGDGSVKIMKLHRKIMNFR